MKASFALSAFILLIAASFVWKDQKRLYAARENHRLLIAEAGKRGFTINPNNPNKAIRVIRRERVDRDEHVRDAISKFLAQGRQLEALKANYEFNEARSKQSLELNDLIASLDDEQVRTVLTSIWLNNEFDKDIRQRLIMFPLLTLATERPRMLLAFYTESDDLLKDSGTEQIIGSSLGYLAKKDPLAALDWFQKNGKTFPELATEDTKRSLISGAAYNDPKIAFQLIGELGIEDSADLIQAISWTARTDEDRDRTLAALSDYLKTLPDEIARDEARTNSICILAKGALQDGFETAGQWMATPNFTADEIETIANRALIRKTKGQETAQWIEWLGENLPAEKSEKSIQKMVGHWTYEDHAAVGNWLTTALEGPVKTTAIQAFDETVSPYQPETAAQWAMTLPPGEMRDSTLKAIYQNWPKDDPASAEAFARKHGLGTE